MRELGVFGLWGALVYTSVYHNMYIRAQELTPPTTSDEITRVEFPGSIARDHCMNGKLQGTERHRLKLPLEASWLPRVW